MKSKALTALKFLIGWPLSLLALFFIAKILAPHIPTFMTRLVDLNVVLLGYGIVSFVIFFFMRGYIWHVLLRDEGYHFSFRETCFLWATSELKRYIPGNLWSFLGRSVSFSERGVSKKDIGRNLLIEIELLVWGALIVSLCAIPFFFWKGFTLIPGQVLIAGVTILILAYAFNHVWRHRLSGRLRTFSDFVLPKSKPIHTLFLIGLSSMSFVFFGLAHFFAITSFVTFDPNLVWQLSGFCVFAFLLGYLSLITPSGLGVREGVLIWGLSSFVSVATAGFLALFARLIFIVSEVIFVGLSLLWHKVRNPTITNIEKWIGEHKHLTILIFCYLMYVLYFSTITYLRYDHFYTGRFDLGNMAQTVWNTTQGRIFEMTNPNGTETVSRLAFHADFILALLSPFYIIWANPKMLLLIQTVVLGAGTFFVYILAREIIKDKNLSLAFAVIFLLNPSVERTNIYDFHAVTLATTFLLATFYFFLKKRYLLFLLFAFLAGICKEQIWFIIGIFGFFLFFWHKKRIFGTVLFFTCVAVSYYLISIAIPNALGAQHFALEYYAEFGDSPVDILKTMVLSPDKILGIIFEQSRLDYLEDLLGPLGYLSLLAPIFLLFAGPDLTINLLSNNQQLHQIYYQYPATITPFLFIAAIYGVRILLYFKNSITYTKQLSNETVIFVVMVYILCMTGWSAYASGPLPGARVADIAMLTKQFPEGRMIDEYIATIPSDAKVSATNNLASHFSEHQYIYVEPMGMEKADYVMFLLIEAQGPQSLAREKELVEKLKQDTRYELIKDEGMFVVFKNHTQ